jgi:subtilisin-like proprotein convertase family protein
MVFYAYQTGSTTTSTLNLYYVQIWDGPPNDPGSSVIFGDLTTNRFVSSTWSNIYRTLDTDPLNTQRPIMATTVDVDVDLAEGTYWIEWTTGGSLASGPWAPPITIAGQTTTGNGMQFLTGAWGPLTDVGPQGLPFQVIGTAGGGGGGCTGDNPVVCTSGDTPLAIPDGNPTGVTSTIEVTPFGGLMIDDLDIGFVGTHSWIGDLIATVNHGATSVAFLDRPGVPASTFGCSGLNPNVVADDEGTDGSLESSCVNGADPGYPVPGGHYTPNSPLSVYDGTDASGTWTLTVSDNATPDSGTLDSWSLIITPDGGGGGTTTYPSTDTPIAIPDSPAPPIVSIIVVPPSDNQVLDVDVDMNVTHSWVGDVGMTLNKDAATVAIFDRPGVPATTFGCSGNNIDIVMDDEGTDGSVDGSCTTATPAYPVPDGHYTPDNPLSAFDGLGVDGPWTLTVGDGAGGDTGTLDSWALIIEESPPVSSPGDPSAVAALRASPNPMSGTGTIELTVPSSQAVRVAVYDLLGREVMVLLDRELSAAQRAFIGLNTERLGAGVYVVRATGVDFELIERVTISR